MVSPLIKLPVIVSMILVWVSLLTGATASSQEGGGASVVVTGRLEVLVTDYFNQGISTTSYLLHVDNGPVYELQFRDSPPEQLSTGQRVTVTGHIIEGNQLRVDNLTPDPDAAMPSTGYDLASLRPQSVAA